MSRHLQAAPASAPPVPSPALLPLGALPAGFGLFHAGAFAQTAPAAPAAPASAASGAGARETTLSPISVKAKTESDATSVRAATTTIGKGVQDLRDVPQSLTVITEKLMEDRRVDTLKQALHQTAGVTFQAAEGGEEDIRLRGFSLAASGDIYVDSIRDPAFYDRDTFSFDRVELLRGSASMLFGRGSTGGVVNQVTKMPFLNDATEVNFTAGTGGFIRFTGDFNHKLTDTSAIRVNVMTNTASGGGGTDKIDKQGIAPVIRWGIGTDDEFFVEGYYLHNNNGINYGLPWTKVSSTQTGSNPSTIASSLNPNKVYYNAASDYNAGGAALATTGWTHRFGDGGQLKSTLRYGRYDRDLRAGTIRYVNAATGLDNVNDSTRLTEGTNNKVQNMNTTYAQSDYTNKFKWFGRDNDVTTGVDLAHEVFNNYTMVVPTGTTLNKNVLPITVGSGGSNDNAVDESARIRRQAAWFDAKSLGLYFQDLAQIAEHWKLLGGLRWDKFKGEYKTFQTADSTTVPLGSTTADRSRTDSLWSKRLGVLFQPNEQLTGYASWGTSFNTSGDTYQYDSQSQNTPPEGSENYELGMKADLFEGRMSARVAAFYSIKTNERDRDPDTAATQSVLSGKRHASGMELDLAGRITPAWEVFGSYAWIPNAKVDEVAPGTTTISGELQGQRPSMTPRHSGTIWTTYQFTPALRLGAGLNARSSQTPNRNPAGIVAPKWVTADALAEYTFSDQIALKLNVTNLTNKFYADSLYTGHYIPGAGRAVQVTMTGRF